MFELPFFDSYIAAFCSFLLGLSKSGIKGIAALIVTGFVLVYGAKASTGILFNHESPRKDEKFVLKKIAKSVARIKFGLQKDLQLGNMDAKSDWGHAKDHVEAMWLMLNQKKPKDYVISTGKHYTVRDFAKLAFDNFVFLVYALID